MATLVNSTKYTDGHPIVINERANKLLLKHFKVGDKFTISSPGAPNSVVDLGGKSTLYVKDSKNNLVLIQGSVSGINTSFNHDAKKGKSNTNKLTIIKENISLWLFLNPNMTEEEVIKKLGDDKDFYRTDYYESAVKQEKVLAKKGFKMSSGYYGERQADSVTKLMYTKAQKISKLHADNWNPSDVWLIKKSFLTEYKKFIESVDIKTHNIHHINSFIQEGINNKTILPISLKHVSGSEAHYELISKDYKFNLDFKLTHVDMDINTFNNFIPWTKSGFAARVGFKSSKTSLSVYVEGRMKGAGYQLGAVDKKALAKHTGFRDGVSTVDVRHAHDIIKQVYSHNKIKMKGKVTTVDDMKNGFDVIEDVVSKKRAYNLLLAMENLLVQAPKQHGQEELYERKYKLARKITDKSSAYLLVH